MRTLSLSLLMTTALLFSGGFAAGQVYQVSNLNGSHEHGQTVVGSYQPTNWNTGCPSGNCQTGVCHAGGSCYSGHHCNNCNGCQDCPLGKCVDGNSCLTNSCLNDTCLGRFCATKAYPDAGWAPPARLPVNRDLVWYQSYWPQAFYGNQGGGFVGNYPQVYQPTDTTQMGYYYSHVPTWQSRPGMIPPVPNPANYHPRVCPNGYGNQCNTCNNGVAHHYAHGYASQAPMQYSPVVHASQPRVVRPASNSSPRRFSFASLGDLFD